ncbi:MAG: hypothetical protein CL920_12290 [Deltaproteobacteria bacterium]|nr:hypothetical protein [Deltaproteobacteria bacterium]MBU49465.1 hypothetical protein [Deltaproteobacteria bacterium]
MMMYTRIALLFLLPCVLLFGLLNCTPNDALHRGECPSTSKTTLLVDLYHSRKQNHEAYRLTKGNYNYQGVFGYARVMDHLIRNDIQVDSLREKPLTDVCMMKYDAVFINLLHEDRPNFSDDELQQLQSYVQQGGGLFVIADHTNVYRHAERLNPLLKPMGIEVLFSTAADTPPSFAIGGNGWIKVFSFETHPVTEALQMISLQTGGAFKTDFGVAKSSKSSFADYWDESDWSGFYGDWKHNGNVALEPKGPLSVVAANTWGQGRVVVAGDQNMFGDAWVHVGDNFSLFMNAITWVTKREKETPHLRDIPFPGLKIGVDMNHSKDAPGQTGPDGFYSFYAHLNRDRDVQARAIRQFDKKDDVLWLLSPQNTFSSSQRDTIRTYLKDGNTVILSFSSDRLTAATIQLLHSIAPDFRWETAQKTYTLDTKADREALLKLRPARIRAALPLSSELLTDAQKLSLGAAGMELDLPSSKSPTLLDIRSDWGKPFIQASYEKQTFDIARRKAVEKGELIIFVQDGFWRSPTLKAKAVEAPGALGQKAVKLLYHLLDYLKSKHKQ